MIWQKASLGSQIERFLTLFERLKFLKIKVRNKYDSVAQLVEQYTFNVWVLGSSPSGITMNINSQGVKKKVSGCSVARYRATFGMWRS